MIHRVVFGSIERFIAILTEHFAGKFPVWLAPVQVRILPISEKYNEYGEKTAAALKAAGLRCELDKRDEKVGYKIREARNQRIPYILVVGEKEQENGTVTVRYRGNEEQTAMETAAFIEKITGEIRERVNG